MVWRVALNSLAIVIFKNLTPAINPCHGFSVIASVLDTGDKFIAGDNDTSDAATGDKFMAGDNDTCEKGVWGVYGMRLFMAVRMELYAAVSDFGGRRYRRVGLK
jgi:hypothetical protein